MKYHDTHIHIDLLKNRNQAIKNLTEKQTYAIAVTNLPSIFRLNKMKIPETKYMRHAIGYHPELVGEFPDLWPVFKDELTKTRYVGEIGLDGSKKHSESFTIQKQIFEKIVKECNLSGNKILTIHSRKAEKEVLQILGKKFNGKIILHWFSGSMGELTDGIDRGYFFSVNLEMITKKYGRQLIQKIPMNKLLIESDAPFAVSEEKLDYENSFKKIAQIISEIKKLSTCKVENQLYLNFKDLLS